MGKITSARPTPPMQIRWSPDLKTLIRLKIEKNQKIRDFRPPPKKGRHSLTPPPPRAKKRWVSMGSEGQPAKTRRTKQLHWPRRTLQHMTVIRADTGQRKGRVFGSGRPGSRERPGPEVEGSEEGALRRCCMSAEPGRTRQMQSRHFSGWAKGCAYPRGGEGGGGV